MINLTKKRRTVMENKLKYQEPSLVTFNGVQIALGGCNTGAGEPTCSTGGSASMCTGTGSSAVLPMRMKKSPLDILKDLL
jgi:hypothetical protein